MKNSKVLCMAKEVLLQDLLISQNCFGRTSEKLVIGETSSVNSDQDNEIWWHIHTYRKILKKINWFSVFFYFIQKYKMKYKTNGVSSLLFQRVAITSFEIVKGYCNDLEYLSYLKYSPVDQSTNYQPITDGYTSNDSSMEWNSWPNKNIYLNSSNFQEIFRIQNFKHFCHFQNTFFKLLWHLYPIYLKFMNKQFINVLMQCN